MGNMTLEQFTRAAEIGGCSTWKDAIGVVRADHKALEVTQERVEQLNDDLDRLYGAKARRRARWRTVATTTVTWAFGALAGGLAYAAHMAGLWP